jgi:hypothetical protein
MSWTGRIVIAVVYAVVAFLACLLIGDVLESLRVAIASTIGAFLVKWADVIAVLVFLYVLFVGYATVPWRRGP